MKWEDMDRDYEGLLQSYEALEKEVKRLKSVEEKYNQIQEDIQKAYLNPRTREALKKIVKEQVGVDLKDPEYEEVFKEKISEVEKRIENIEKKGVEERLKQQDEQTRALLAKYGIATKEDIEDFKKFIQKKKAIPVGVEGLESFVQEYQRTKMASPSYVRPSSPVRNIAEEYSKNPKEAFYKAHLRALGQNID